jgi:hypothetical protein
MKKENYQISLYKNSRYYVIVSFKLSIKKIASRLKDHYACKILECNRDAVAFLPPEAETIQQMLASGKIQDCTERNSKI